MTPFPESFAAPAAGLDSQALGTAPRSLLQLKDDFGSSIHDYMVLDL
jgi:hypothetical protein